MIKLTIDHRSVEVPEGYTVLQACEEAGVEIPVFCYHPKLSIAGNCRMCLVEMEKSPKPIASCAMPATDGMVIYTQSESVKKARQGTLELLLINHPLDCPICDQGGECDLQDITMSYGRGTSRFTLNKRAVADKYMGPLIKTSMTRCIHCTRCVRFAHEIAGTSELGTTGRGEHVEITSFLESAITTELSGNLVDICPVGALTSKPYAFQGRSWELTKTPSIDVMDAVGSLIRVDSRGIRDVMRVLPRAHDEINEDWISDKTRYAIDGLKYQRLDRPYVRQKGKLVATQWDEALDAAAKKISSVKGSEIAAFVGDLCDVESMYALKKLMLSLGSPHLECRLDGSTFQPKVREDYLFNTTIQGLEKADVILLIGTNPRQEASLVNARIRKRYLMGDVSIGLLGPQADLTYPYDYLGETPADLSFLQDQKHPFTQKLMKSQNPAIICGEAVLCHQDNEKILHHLRAFILEHRLIKEEWNPFNILHTSASKVGALDLHFLPQKGGYALHEIYDTVEKGEIKVLYLLGADTLDFSRLKKAFIIYQGHHGETGAAHADVILPGAAYTEKNGLYVNIEGRIQQGLQAVSPPGDAKEDWRILRALSEKLDHTLPFDDIETLHHLLREEHPHFRIMNEVMRRSYAPHVDEKLIKGSLSKTPFSLPISNFYMTNIIARHSKTMAECSLVRGKALKGQPFLKTDVRQEGAMKEGRSIHAS